MGQEVRSQKLLSKMGARGFWDIGENYEKSTGRIIMAVARRE